MLFAVSVADVLGQGPEEVGVMTAGLEHTTVLVRCWHGAY